MPPAPPTLGFPWNGVTCPGGIFPPPMARPLPCVEPTPVDAGPTFPPMLGTRPPDEGVRPPVPPPKYSDRGTRYSYLMPGLGL